MFICHGENGFLLSENNFVSCAGYKGLYYRVKGSSSLTRNKVFNYLRTTYSSLIGYTIIDTVMIVSSSIMANKHVYLFENY